MSLTFPADKLVLFAMSIGLLTFVISYSISVQQGYIYYPFYFLSSSINIMPASSVGSFGLPLALLPLPPLMYLKYVQVSDRVALSSTSSGGDWKWTDRANVCSLYSSVIAAFGGHTVAAFQASSNLQIHLFGAGFFFSFSLLIAVLQCFIDHTLHVRTFSSRLRLFNTFVGVGSLGAMGILGLITLVKYTTSTMPLSFVFPMSVLELVFFFSCMGVYLTYFMEFRDFEFVLSVRRKKGRTELDAKSLTNGVDGEVEGVEKSRL